MRCAVVWASADTRGRYGDGRGDNGGNGGQGGQSGTPHLACCRRPRSERRAPRRGAAAARLVASVGALRCAQADVRSRCSPRQRRATAAAVARRSASWPRRRPCRTHANCAAGVVSHWTPSAGLFKRRTPSRLLAGRHRILTVSPNCSCAHAEKATIRYAPTKARQIDR